MILIPEQSGSIQSDFVHDKHSEIIDYRVDVLLPVPQINTFGLNIGFRD